MRTPEASATSAMKLTSRPISIGQGSTKLCSPRSLSSLRRSTAFLRAARLSNFGAAQSSSHPAQPMSKCSCISVVPSCSAVVVPVTVFMDFIGANSFAHDGLGLETQIRPRWSEPSNAARSQARTSVFFRVSQRAQDNQGNPNRDRTVGDVEDRVIPLVIVDTHKIDDLTAQATVHKIAARTGQNQGEGQGR